MKDKQKSKTTRPANVPPAGVPQEEKNDRGGEIDIEEYDKVDEASKASFPASDPPSFTPITSIGPPSSSQPET